MAKEKVVNQEPQTQFERQCMIADARENAEISAAKLQIKASKSYDKYLHYKNIGKYKEAMQELKWYSINEKLQNLTQKIIEFLDRVEDIENLFQVLGQVNVGLSAINGFQNGKELSSLKKNLKGMVKCIKKLDKIADDLMKTMDNMFGGGPNIFVRFFNFITGNKI